MDDDDGPKTRRRVEIDLAELAEATERARAKLSIEHRIRQTEDVLSEWFGADRKRGHMASILEDFRKMDDEIKAAGGRLKTLEDFRTEIRSKVTIVGSLIGLVAGVGTALLLKLIG